MHTKVGLSVGGAVDAMDGDGNTVHAADHGADAHLAPLGNRSPIMDGRDVGKGTLADGDNDMAEGDLCRGGKAVEGITQNMGDRIGHVYCGKRGAIPEGSGAYDGEGIRQRDIGKGGAAREGLVQRCEALRQLDVGERGAILKGTGKHHGGIADATGMQDRRLIGRGGDAAHIHGLESGTAGKDLCAEVMHVGAKGKRGEGGAVGKGPLFDHRGEYEGGVNIKHSRVGVIKGGVGGPQQHAAHAAVDGGHGGQVVLGYGGGDLIVANDSLGQRGAAGEGLLANGQGCHRKIHAGEGGAACKGALADDSERGGKHHARDAASGSGSVRDLACAVGNGERSREILSHGYQISLQVQRTVLPVARLAVKGGVLEGIRADLADKIGDLHVPELVAAGKGFVADIGDAVRDHHLGDLALGTGVGDLFKKGKSVSAMGKSGGFRCAEGAGRNGAHR